MNQLMAAPSKPVEVEGGLRVQLKFQRRIQHHLLTTYLPTFCLMLVCQSGLYFR